MSQQSRSTLGLVFKRRSPIDEAKAILEKYQVPRADPTADFVPNPRLEDDLQRMLRLLG